MQDAQLLRYARHILLDELGVEGQEALLNAQVLIVGAGGLGCPAALYLAASGVGKITVVDDDVVDLTNLQRQIAHSTASVGQPKVQSLAAAAAALNPEVTIAPVQARADASLLDAFVPQASVVLDCCDNWATRHVVNAACVRHRVPLVSGAAVRLDGQIAVFDTRQKDNPCYACLFSPENEFEEISCAQMGVLSPLVGMIGSMQAIEAIKIIANMGKTLSGRLLMINALKMDVHTLHTAKNPDCPVCGLGQI